MTLLEFSGTVKDHRVDLNKQYSAECIVFMTLCGAICGCQTWKEIVLFAESKKEFFKDTIQGYTHTPSHDTFERFFALLDVKSFEQNFRSYAQELVGAYQGHIAIDGKSIRSTFNDPLKGKGKKRGSTGRTLRERLHIVSAFAVDQGICLCQEKTGKKRNEISVIPKLLKAMDIQGCVITIDAMGTQHKIAKQIIKQKGDYIFVVKDNQRGLHNDLKEFVESYYSEKMKKRTDQHTVTEKIKGALVKRTCYVGNNKWNFGKEFPFEGMRSFGWIQVCRQEKGKEQSQEIRFFISSLEMDAKRIMQTQQRHWAIENNLHWWLDVAFDEDDTRKKGNAAVNFSLINKLALAAITKTPEKHAVIAKRKLAGWDDKFLRKIIGLI